MEQTVPVVVLLLLAEFYLHSFGGDAVRAIFRQDATLQLFHSEHQIVAVFEEIADFDFE